MPKPKSDKPTMEDQGVNTPPLTISPSNVAPDDSPVIRSPEQPVLRTVEPDDVEEDKKDTRTPEEIHEAKKAFMKAQGFDFNDPPPEKKEEDKETEKPGEEKTEDKDPEKTEDEKLKDKTKGKVKRKPITEEEVERIASRKASEVAEEARHKPEVEAPRKEEEQDLSALDLTPQDERALSVMRKMGDLNPKVKDLADKTIKFWKKESEYISKWENDHPEETYNPDAPDHKRLYAEEPKFDPRDYDEASEVIRDDRAVKEVEKRLRPELDRLQAKEEWREKEPVIHRDTGIGMREFVHMAVDSEVGKLMEKDGEIVLTNELAAKIEELDPLAWAAIKREAEPLQIKLQEFWKLTHLDKFYRPRDDFFAETVSGQRVYAHRELLDFAQRKEREILARPKARQLFEGRQFIPLRTLGEMIDRVRKSPVSRDQKNRDRASIDDHYWWLEPPDIAKELIRESAKRVKEYIEPFKNILKKNVNKPITEASRGTQGVPKSKVEDEAEEEEQDDPPTTASSSDITDNTRGGKGGSPSNEDLIIKNW